MADRTKNTPENLVAEKKTWIRPDVQMIERGQIMSGPTQHFLESNGSTYNGPNS